MARGKRPTTVLPDLSPLELEVMSIVWKLGECSSAEVIEQFRQKRPLAETTIRTVLTNIRKKGYLEPVPTIERGFRVRPIISKQQVRQRSLKYLLGRLFNGSPREAISFLLKEEKLDEDDLREIRDMIDQYKKKGGK